MSRVTQNMLTRNFMLNTNRNLYNMQRNQTQLSSGKEISKASQDPYKATRIMQLYTDIDANKQYKENIKDAGNWLDATDTSLGQMQNIFARIRELQVSVGNGTYKENERTAIQVEIKQKSEELVQILNSNFDGEYIFGGTKSQSKPITKDAAGNITYADQEGNVATKVTTGIEVQLTNTIIKTSTNIKVEKVLGGSVNTVVLSDGTSLSYNPAKDLNDATDTTNATLKSDFLAKGFLLSDFNKLARITDSSTNTINQISAPIKTEVSQGVLLEYGIGADEILDYGNGKSVVDVLNKIINNLQPQGTMITNLDGTVEAADPSKVSGSLLTEVDKVINNLLNKRAKVGVLSNRMESAQNRNEADNESMTNILSKTEDIDYAEKMMEYSVLQTVYQASLQVSGKILPLTIMNYL